MPLVPGETACLPKYTGHFETTRQLVSTGQRGPLREAVRWRCGVPGGKLWLSHR